MCVCVCVCVCVCCVCVGVLCVCVCVYLRLLGSSSSVHLVRRRVGMLEIRAHRLIRRHRVDTVERMQVCRHRRHKRFVSGTRAERKGSGYKSRGEGQRLRTPQRSVDNAPLLGLLPLPVLVGSDILLTFVTGLLVAKCDGLRNFLSVATHQGES